FLGRKMTEQSYEYFVFFSDIVSVGLKLLWVTGFGFLVFYWANDPIKLQNEKVWAKMVIVGILTINGMFIHKTILPLIGQRVGTTMLYGLSLRRRAVLVTSGMVLVVSWYTPLIIANIPHLNFQVPMVQILALYGAALLGVLIVAHMALFGAQIAETMRYRIGGRRHL
ncbi:MAG: hypothetical protein AAFQ09_07495, partial [Pseudomonadota bacterium]